MHVRTDDIADEDHVIAGRLPGQCKHLLTLEATEGKQLVCLACFMTGTRLLLSPAWERRSFSCWFWISAVGVKDLRGNSSGFASLRYALSGPSLCCLLLMGFLL